MWCVDLYEPNLSCDRIGPRAQSDFVHEETADEAKLNRGPTVASGRVRCLLLDHAGVDGASNDEILVRDAY
jgi:hypothetical protein